MSRRTLSSKLLLLSLGVAMPYALGQDNDLKSVDLQKIRAHRSTRFIEHVFWPSEAIISRKSIRKETIPEDIQRFKKMLSTVLRPEYAVTPATIDANAVAVEEVRDANDYVLLEYARNKKKLKIQDGKALWITIFPEEGGQTKIADIRQYVRAVALEILNIPKVDEEGNEPRIFVSSLDIGDSKFGTIVYRASFPPKKLWYSHMGWWSDGQNVMFTVGKLTFNEGEASGRRSGPPANLGKPRKFKKKPA